MSSRFLVSAVVFAAFAAVGAGPSFALSTKECSVKYQAAKSAGTLNGETWAEFRKKECAAGAEAAAPATTEQKPAAKSETAAPSASGAIFPKAIDPKYSKETAGKARMHTCLDQYRANKANNGNGGLKWIQKGGGYYSQCNASLKS
ncbi:hypothetical protein [Hyphomicrobium sp.]|uniref:hypothetical protein n=1 Tax=Hyphomicrobium sp. TaxID=82 RepID=UPI000F92D063|nr:hypothetical protein [Hyphomicrobium sp.]RUP09105.1 MAG: hypothetical protein EKK38_10725 [Hyphomicrobium sp.]